MNERDENRAEDPHLLTLKDVAWHLQFSENTVRAMLERKECPPPDRRIGRHPRWSRPYFLGWFDGDEGALARAERIWAKSKEEVSRDAS